MKWEMEVEEEKEIEAVLEKIWDLHDKLSDAIHSITRAHFLNSINKPRKPDDLYFHHRSKKRTGPDSDQNAGWKNEFRVDEEDDSAAVHEAKSLNAIRTALENLEDQLEFFHTVQTQQRVERDVALARLEQSRIILAMRLADHKALVAFSMLALMHMQHAGCKERHFLDYPPRREDVLHNQTHTKVSRPQDSSSSGVKQLDVLSARG
nr:plastid division protein PDV1 [Ipomoea batatas]